MKTIYGSETNKMNERIRELMLTAGYAAPELAERAHKLIDLVLKDCYTAIDRTNRHHVHTTFDEQLVQATIERSKQAVREHFGVEL
jgi:hypothetical protein